MKRASLPVTLSALSLSLVAVSGCKPQGNVEEIRQSLPTASAVQVKVPGGGRALGETATFYSFTRGVSVDLNGGAAWTLILVRTIVSFPVTSIDGDTYIWGPWHDALSPSEYRLTVVQTAAGDYDWSLEGRRVADGAGAPFESVIAGTATPGQPLRGSGAFTIDFDTAEKLDPAGNDGQGVIDVSYDLERDPAEIVMDFTHDALNEQGVLAEVTAHYEYREARDGSGDFVFAIHSDLDENGSAWEQAEVRSRWLATGAGRSDVHISSGDLGGQVLEGSECWDTSFARVFWTDSLNWNPTEGDASACAFAQAAMP
jgi:hypothetical protein